MTHRRSAGWIPSATSKTPTFPGGRFNHFEGGSIFWTPDRRTDVRWNID